MFSFSFKNRIAFYYIISTALLIGFVFLFLFHISKLSINSHINGEIEKEQQKHLKNVTLDSNQTYLIRVNQWRDREHNSVDVNPVFVEFYDNNKELIDKSPNLKDEDLSLYSEKKNNKFVDSEINGKKIRQIQTEIVDDNNVVGYMVVAMSLDDVVFIIILQNVLLITYPLILVILFFIARFFAGRSIAPISNIIETSSSITKDNLSSRIPLPVNKDELYQLSLQINQLLDRIESAVEREKQFTSDASHELRTPLAVIKGTLEVLIRKPRTKEEYDQKIAFCISEVDRLNTLVDQLLLLARFENQKKNIKNDTIHLNALILDILSRFSQKIKEKNISVLTKIEENCTLNSDYYLISIIFNNLISNALKYSNPDSILVIEAIQTKNGLKCKVTDSGIGISKEDLDKIYNSFFRSNATMHPEIKGTGIGLSIVKRLCDLLKIEIVIESIEEHGTTVILSFS
ncbi:HAMP domain-containing histidine kinase [Flavobacterium sp. NRK F10]|uniref:sensor histidine kinase n=1 Tax=Flavobacterium sp. NRK F10 TaxID=2954931 RepID=UPI002091A424|nr:HAMP domain-containing sensor histidine kinase [Flavobacterium sp. NRK F10]MCO6176311.1 HAMP domain-containing histidine kinase [Flavobacterium sp. NRK F10]